MSRSSKARRAAREDTHLKRRRVRLREISRALDEGLPLQLAQVRAARRLRGQTGSVPIHDQEPHLITELGLRPVLPDVCE
ncbi:hypothetical protein [Deinococcus multiflagellatus]|uniref:Uncharacterized protein n=1 Tax=Deinococcus multiflagellatus TaxID=1656887 RepID=A0ABW1ZRI7_9DEIO|nr:hypothetical protein [Deinococcus multiflagellatus]MBZ9715517.1 hypothetical protein [Deinococcus multiflagellatus]